jgi:pSer/pThr/pTyr-binding forkhead associated (FHA) protein
MSQKNIPSNKNSSSIDWLLRGTLTKLGDIFDRFTGRSWKPSSSLATSELIERLKKLLDSEIKDLDKKGKFVPHNLKLKMQWDKFSTDAEDAMKKLENELLTAVIDHINDNRYHTYAPLKLEVKPDYFIEGVKLFASFDEFAEEETGGELNVTVTNLKNIVIVPPIAVEIREEKEIFIAEFILKEKPQRVELTFAEGERSSVGRTKENVLSIDDASVSKVHAALVLNGEKQLMVADTGSTNGTFINDRRIAYGKAFAVAEGDKLKFGTVEVSITHVPKEVEPEPEIEEEFVTESSAATEQMITGDEYLTRSDSEAETVSVSEEIPADAETVLTEKIEEAPAEAETVLTENIEEAPAEAETVLTENIEEESRPSEMNSDFEEEK